MNEWYPIEIAPRDGTPILLSLLEPLHRNDIDGHVPWKEIHVVIGWWDDSWGIHEQKGHWELCFMLEGSADSYGYTSNFFTEISCYGANGWMPLPQPKQP